MKMRIYLVNGLGYIDTENKGSQRDVFALIEQHEGYVNDGLYIPKSNILFIAFGDLDGAFVSGSETRQ